MCIATPARSYTRKSTSGWGRRWVSSKPSPGPGLQKTDEIVSSFLAKQHTKAVKKNKLQVAKIATKTRCLKRTGQFSEITDVFPEFGKVIVAQMATTLPQLEFFFWRGDAPSPSMLCLTVKLKTSCGVLKHAITCQECWRTSGHVCARNNVPEFWQGGRRIFGWFSCLMWIAALFAGFPCHNNA